jgi:putative tricarboxylic transport membrane protein
MPCLAACVGTLIGVLPGIGPVATIAMLLPITFHLPPTASLIMLAGIYYGAAVWRFDDVDPGESAR